MTKTYLKKLAIEKFRALNNVEVEFGDHITVVCGKNGTSKSSILGIAAQIFSFEKTTLRKKGFHFGKLLVGRSSPNTVSTSEFRKNSMFPAP
jgi:predicted ATP-dependent endonuclease of OLD family